MHSLLFSLMITLFIYSYLYQPFLFYIYWTVIAIYTILCFVFAKGAKNSFKNKVIQSNFEESGDNSVLGQVKVECDAAQQFIEEFNKKNPNQKITFTSLALKAMGHTSQDSNQYGNLSFGTFTPLKSVDISVAVSIDGENLFQYVARDCGRKGIKEISKDLRAEVKKIKMKKNDELKHQMSIIRKIPSFIMKPIFELNKFFAYDLGINFKPFKIKKYQYGNLILSNVMNFKLHDFFAPNVPMAKSIFTMLMCSPKKTAVVRDGKIVVRNIMNLNVTFDHRFADGAQFKSFYEKLIDVFNHPENYLQSIQLQLNNKIMNQFY